jgi:hypothetical protein
VETFKCTHTCSYEDSKNTQMKTHEVFDAVTVGKKSERNEEPTWRKESSIKLWIGNTKSWIFWQSCRTCRRNIICDTFDMSAHYQEENEMGSCGPTKCRASQENGQEIKYVPVQLRACWSKVPVYSMEHVLGLKRHSSKSKRLTPSFFFLVSPRLIIVLPILPTWNSWYWAW